MSALLAILGPWPAGVESWAAPCAAGVRSTSGDQGGEPDCLGTSVLEHRDIRRRGPDRLRELADTHLASHEHDVQLDPARHQITPASSRSEEHTSELQSR